ncbi:transposable element Tcb1 transposase [Trichonephila clavipes]|nr:transposable element Tcb1 transposase [Trichonephila clavipes]
MDNGIDDIVFNDESRFCLQYHDGRVRVWRHRGERLLNCCAMHRLTGPAPDIVLWIELLPWPTFSPDLSPIENLWSMLAQRLARDTPPAATPNQLRQYMEAAWITVPQGYIQSLFDSMPRRIAADIANNGGYTNY